MPIQPGSALVGVGDDAVLDAAVSQHKGQQKFALARAVVLVDPATGLPYTASAGGGGGGAVTVADGADVALGATTATPATDDTGNWSLIRLTKRLLQRITTLLSDGGAVSGTRAYNFASAARTAVGATSSAAIAIGTLGASREVMLVASTRCFIRWGDSGVTAAAAADADVLALPADAMFHLRVPVGVTHFRVIRDTADGFLRATPVA